MKRNPGPDSTTARGYGYQHQQARKRALAEFTRGQPCARCGQPIFNARGAELDHNEDRTGYIGLSHAYCNRKAGGEKSTRPQGAQPSSPFGFWSGGWNVTSRDW